MREYKKEYETPQVIETLTEEQVFGTEDLMASAWGDVWGDIWTNGGGGSGIFEDFKNP